MPELPEVETVCRGLAKAMTGRAIARVDLRRKNLRFPFPPALKALRDVGVEGISRRAKYILVRLADGRTMIVHLGMSGRMVIGPAQKPGKHDHMILILDDGQTVTLNDARRFGIVDLARTEELEGHKLFRHLGPEPLGRGFTPAYLAHAIAGKKPAIKIALMDQRVVVGVGNIYASEALYDAGIDPHRAAGSLKEAEAEKLVRAVRDVLKRAIKAGGSSLRDYVQADGNLGYFQHQWAVYGKAGETCPACKKPCIEKTVQGGRATFYCRARQK